MINWLLNLIGREIVYQCDWGTFHDRYDSTDAMMGRPIHPDMSTAPPWAKMRIRKRQHERRCGGIMTADLGSIDDRVVLKCRDCGATANVDGNDYALGLHDSSRCREWIKERPPQ